MVWFAMRTKGFLFAELTMVSKESGCKEDLCWMPHVRNLVIYFIPYVK